MKALQRSEKLSAKSFIDVGGDEKQLEKHISNEAFRKQHVEIREESEVVHNLCGGRPF